MKTRYWVLIGFVIGFILMGMFIGSLRNPNNPYQEQNNEIKIIDECSNKGRLESLLFKLENNTYIKNGNCLSYALYYKDYLNKNYPKLDVRKIDKAGICPIGTKECGDDEGMLHTYLIVNGYGAECILDQHQIACIEMKGSKTKCQCN